MKVNTILTVGALILMIAAGACTKQKQGVYRDTGSVKADSILAYLDYYEMQDDFGPEGAMKCYARLRSAGNQAGGYEGKAIGMFASSQESLMNDDPAAASEYIKAAIKLSSDKTSPYFHNRKRG